MKNMKKSVSMGILLGAGLLSFSGTNLSEIFAETWTSFSFAELLERSSEDPANIRSTRKVLIEEMNRATQEKRRPTYTYRRRRHIQPYQEWDLSITKREGISDLDREKLRQERARKKALRLRRR